MTVGTLLGWLMSPRIHSFLHAPQHKGWGNDAAILRYTSETQLLTLHLFSSFISLLAGCGLVGIGFIERCWTTEVAEGMWMILGKACSTDPVCKGWMFPIFLPWAPAVGLHVTVWWCCQHRVGMDVLEFARCSCEMWPREHSTDCFLPSVKVQWLSLSPWGQVALRGCHPLHL